MINCSDFFLIHKPWGAGAWNLISEGDYIELTVLPMGPHKWVFYNLITRIYQIFHYYCYHLFIKIIINLHQINV